MKRTWYQRIWEKQDLTNTNPKLEPFLNPDKFPKFQANATIQLTRQLLPLTPPKELVIMTPEKLGMVLGQKQANLYGMKDYFQSLAKEPQAIERGKAVKREMEQQAHIPEVANNLELLHIVGMFVNEFNKSLPRFKRNIQDAFKAALVQPNYQEAVEFFRGFAKGLATQGFNDGKIVRNTPATDLHLNMFMRSQKFKKFRTVKELRAFLLQNGFTQDTLGDDSRLQKYCTRVGYAPGKKRRRPAKSKQ